MNVFSLAQNERLYYSTIFDSILNRYFRIRPIKNPMPTTFSYRLLIPQKPTDCLRTNTCLRARYAEIHDSVSPRPTANYSLLTANSSFTFSAKERDPETGLSYFGSRYYSSDLSIWLSVDPMAAKYASLSPYVYCANNPVKLVDLDGEEIEIVTTIDENGNKIITINFTAKIVNKSSHPFSKRKMEKMRDEILKHYFENYRHNHH